MNFIQNLCCWGTDYCKCQILKLSRNQNIKLTYIILIFCLMLTTGLIGRSPSPALIQRFQCDLDSTDELKQKQCSIQQLSFRWFLALALMHFLLVVFVALRNQFSKIINEGAWLGKVLFVIGIGFIYMFLMANGFIRIMMTASAYMIPLFYLFQNLIIIDMIYTADSSLSQVAQKSPKIHVVKAFFGLCAVIGAVVLNVLSYVHHRDQKQSLYISIVGSICIGVFLLIVLLRVVKGNSLFVYGFIMAYLQMQGYFLHCPASEYTSSTYPIIQIIIVVFSLLSILSPGSNKIRTKKSSINESLALNTSKQQQDNRYVSSNKWLVFHVIFCIICMTLPLVLHSGGQAFLYGEGSSNVWQNLFKTFRIIGWIMTIVIYVWTIVAARLYPEQDFDQLQNYFKQFQLN